jgi:hypothetical protein
MEFLYLSVNDQFSWEDVEIYDSEEEAIKASIVNPQIRIEKFYKLGKKYRPTYNYYRNGNLMPKITSFISPSNEQENETLSVSQHNKILFESEKYNNVDDNYKTKENTEIDDLIKTERCSEIPQRIKRQTNDLPIKLGDQYYEIDKEYLLAGHGEIPDDIITHGLLELTNEQQVTTKFIEVIFINGEKIDSSGFSEYHPGYFFEVKKQMRDTIDDPTALIYSLKIVKHQKLFT